VTFRSIVPLLVVAALASCGREAPRQATADVAPHQLTPAQLSFLKFAPVADVAGGELAELTGTVDFDEERTARLSSAVSGRVVELLVRVGDHNDADQPLVVIDSPEVRAAETAWVRAQSDDLVARKAAERAEHLRAARAMAEKDYLQAMEDARKAAAELDGARAALERLRVEPGARESRYVLRSPLAGTVVERRALVGMETGPESAEPLVVVSDLSRVRVTVHVPERQLALLAVGQAIAVRVDGYAEAFPGEVAAIGDAVDDATRTVPVRCTVANPEHRLKPAMFARVALKAPPELHYLAVPTTALLSDGDGYRVLVHHPDGTLEERPVETGAESGGRVQVLGGLAAGEEVVVEGAIFAAQEMARS
jgi:membrane fusion protein, heavy metal efflux system